jgi:sugar-specific transcriptional regulator TrmB
MAIKVSKSLLNSLSLRESEFEVYAAALSLGEGTMQDLARRSGVKRTSIYAFIDELKSRGFITETKKKKRRVYSAVSPSQLVEMEKTRLTELEGFLPELLTIHNKSKKKPRVVFYDGVEGIEEVYGDMLRDQKEIIAYEDLEHMKLILPKSFYNYFPPERARRGIPFRSITRDSATAREFIKNNPQLLRNTKLLQSKDFKTEINIYGNKVAMMSYGESSPFCVLIEDANIAQTLRITWEELWNRLRTNRDD